MSAQTIPTIDEVRRKRVQIIRALHARGAGNVRVFGSVARGDAVPESDVDILVDFDGPTPTGFRYFGMIYDLQEELANILGRPVHVVEVSPTSALSPTERRIVREAVPL